MSNPTNNANNSALCHVTYGPLWTEMMGVKSGKVLRLPYGPNNWSTLARADQEFLASFTTDAIGDESEMTLTFDVIRRFKGLCDRFGEKQPANTVLVNVVAPPTTPIVPPIATPLASSASPVASPAPIAPVPVDIMVSDKTTAKMVRELERKTIGIGADYAERELDALAKIANSVDGKQYYLLQYDIPERRNKECPSPVGIFRRHAVYFTESVIWIDEAGLKHKDVQEVMAVWNCYPDDVIYHVIAQDRNQNAYIRKIAEQKLRKLLIQHHTSLIEGIDRADKALAEAMADPDNTESADDLQSTRNNAVRSKIRNAIKELESAIRCAEKFDAEDKIADLMQGLRHAIRSQAETFNVLARAKRIKPAPTV